jgi:hypothetical protein
MHEEIILNYYKKNVERYRFEGYPEKYNPDRWITKYASIDKGLAEYIQFLIVHNQADFLSLDEVQNLARNFYYQCITKHGIVLDEECKGDYPLKELFFDAIHEIGSLDDPYCNTDRTILDLTIDLILRPESVYSKFCESKKCVWDYICVAELSNHLTMSDYLLRCLIYDCKPGWIDRIIDALAIQGDKRLGVSLERYLNPDFPCEGGVNLNILNESIQCAAIRYVRDVGLEDGPEILNAAEKNLYEVNRPALVVALQTLSGGEADLLRLYESTEDVDIKLEVLDCYELFRTKTFAQLLLKTLRDNHKLENGYYPLRSIALDALREERFGNLIRWFGPDILNVFSETVVEE